MATDSRLHALRQRGWPPLARARAGRRPCEQRPRLRKPRVALALTAAILCCGASRAPSARARCRPRRSRPSASRTATARCPRSPSSATPMATASATTRSACPPRTSAAPIRHRLRLPRHAGTLAGDADGAQRRERLLPITGHAGEMLGYTVVGNDVNDDGLADIAIGAPMAGPPAKYGGGAVYVVFGRHEPGRRQHHVALVHRPDERPVNPATPSPPSAAATTASSRTRTRACRWPRCPTSTATATAISSWARPMPPSTSRRRRRGRALRQAAGRPHHAQRPLGERYPYFFHVDFPALDDQNIGTSVASVGDMTGDGQPDIAIGAPHADPNGRIDAGSVWIISAHLPPIVGCTQASPAGRLPVDQAQRPHGRTGLPHRRRRGRRSARHVSRGHRRPERRRHPRPRDRRCGRLPQRSSPDRARSSSCPGRATQTTRDLAVTPPLQTIYGPVAGAGLGASLAAAGNVGGDGHDDFLAGAPGEAGLGRRRLPRDRRRPARPPTSRWRRPRSPRRARAR